MAIKFEITGDNRNLLNSLDGASKGVHKTAQDIESTGKSLEDVFSNVGKAIGAAFTLATAKQFVSKMYEVRSYFQDIESSMVVFLGSQEKAAKFTADLKDYAWYNMFEFSDLADASKQLIAYGNDVERISGKGGILDQLSNIATATKQPLMDLVDLWNKAKNTGTVASEAMYQWANKGLVLKDVLTDMGETVRGNSVTFEQLQMAISKVTSEGGMFAGIMDEMMPNLSSSMGQLEDDLASMWNDLGLAMQEPMKKGIEFASVLVDNYQTIGESIAALIGVYGTYKAAIIAINAAEKVHVMWTNAETVANRINSIATAGDATAKGTATAATVLLAKAQASLNAIMLANPYVLVATAMASAVALLIMFKNELRDTAEITGDLNDALAGLKDLDDESSSIKSLADEYDTLKSKAELSADETERLLRITEQLAKYLPSAIKVYDEYGNAIDINTESVREDIKARRDALNLTIGELLDESETKKQNILAQIEAQKKIYQQGIVTEARQSVSSTSGYISTTYNKREATKEEKIAAAKKAQELYKELDELNVSIGEATKTLDGYYESLGQFTSSISGKSIDDLKAIQKAITDSINEGKKGIVSVGDFSYDFTGKSDEFIADALKAINNKLPMSGTSTTDTVGDKIAEANRKIKEMMSDNALDQEKMAKDRERAIAEATVRAMDEGYDKVIAERDRQNKEELDKIEEQKKEAIRKTIEAERKLYYEREKVKKTNDPKYIIQDFDESTVDVSQIEADFDKLYSLTQKRQENDIRKSILDEMKSYITEYGTMQQQRLVIADEYNKKIAQSTNEWQKKSLEKEMDNALESLRIAALQTEIDWSTMFSSVGNILEDEMRSTLDSIESFMKSDEFKKLSATDKRQYSEFRSNLKGRLGIGVGAFDFSIYDKIGKDMEAYQKAVKEAKDAQLQHTIAVNALAEAEERLNKATTEEEKIIAQQGVVLAQRNVSITEDRQINAQNEVDSAQMSLTDSTEAAALSLDQFSNAISQMSNGTLKGFADGIVNVIAAIRGTSGKGLEGLGKVGGIVGAILGIIDSLGDDPAGFIESLIDKIFNVIYGLMDQAMSFSADKNLISRIVAALVNGIVGFIQQALESTATFGLDFLGTTSWLSGLFGNDREMSKEIDNLSKSNEKLADSIDNFADRISDEESTNQQSIQAYQNAIQAEKEWRENQLNIINDTADSWTNTGYGWLGLGGKKSFSYYMGELGQDVWDGFSKALGKEVNSGNILSLTPEEMKILRDLSPKEWSAFLNAGGHKSPEDAINEYIDRADMFDEIQDKLNEKLAGITWDSFRDGYKSLLSDMESDTEDFADNIQKVISDGIVDSLMRNKYDSRLKELYAMVTDAASDDDITKDEADAIRDANKKLTDEMLAERERLKQLGLLVSDSQYSQSASSKGFQAMGQVTGEELNGRFTALQIAGESVASNVVSVYGQMIAMTALQTSGNDFLKELRDMMMTATSYLEDIAKYSKKMYVDFGETLVAIEDNTKNM